MSFIQKWWEKYKRKSILGKSSDVFFLVFAVLMLTNDGRVFFQRMMLKTGVFNASEKNSDIKLTDQDWSMQLINQQGEFLTLVDLRGKPIFLNFWATWCPPCNAEMPSILSLMEKTEGQVNFMFVTNEDRGKVEAHLDSKGWNIPVYYLQNYAGSKLQASSLPTTFIIDKNGVIIHSSSGMRNWSNSENLFQ